MNQSQKPQKPHLPSEEIILDGVKFSVRTLFPHASKAFIDANRSIQSAQLEQTTQRPDAKRVNRGKEAGSKRRVLRYTIYRCKLLDPENVCTKFLTDALRYCGAIPDDTIADIEVRYRQKKVENESQEKTLIELW
jgi:hypothetical protein